VAQGGKKLLRLNPDEEQTNRKESITGYFEIILDALIQIQGAVRSNILRVKYVNAY